MSCSIPVSKQLFCCNPFFIKGHSRVNKNLRPVQEWMKRKSENLVLGYKICTSCRKKLSKKNNEVESDVNIQESDPEDNAALDNALSSLNNSLQSLGESPVKSKRLNERSYPKKKLMKIDNSLRLVLGVESEGENKPKMDDETEIISQLKNKFKNTTKKSEKIQILTILPESWSTRKVQEEFGATNFMVRKAKKLVKEKGILSTPNLRPGKTIKDDTVTIVKSFYNDDDISRCLPGKKDYKTISTLGVKSKVQKRLLLCNLREGFALFKEKNPELKIGFSKFCELRPKNIILAGASGSHNVCVCAIHQNVKLMLIGAKMKELSADQDFNLSSYKHCLSWMICNPPLPECFEQKCKSCPGTTRLKECITKLFDENGIDEIIYKQWITTDRSTLETLIKSADDFLDELLRKLSMLLMHSFVAKEQSKFLDDLKSELKEGELILICDFSENFSFVIQDEVQGFHWNSLQATIHPIIVYYKEANVLKHRSIVVISECLIHNTVAVHLFQKKVIELLHDGLIDEKTKKIFYFSDGCAAQYKNKKNFINLCYHKADFGIDAEWHFFATSHGKGPSDGLGGTVKRLASKASLQRPFEDQILTPFQLYLWCTENIKNCNFVYAKIEEHIEEEKALKERFSQCQTIVGTRKKHCYIPQSKSQVKTKTFSNSSESVIDKVVPSEDDVPLENINGFVACVYDSKWYLGCVLDVFEESNEVKISFLQPHGPSKSFTFPSRGDIKLVPTYAVLAKIDVSTAPGRTYSLKKKDEKHIITKFLAVMKSHQN